VFVVVLTTAIVTLVPSQPSVTEGGVKLQTVPYSTVSLGAQLIVGTVLSITVTTWLQRLVFRQESYASQTRVALKVLPQKPTWFVVVLATRTVTFVPSLLSIASGVAKDHVVPHSTVWLLPQVNAGGVVSTTVTV
jgi:membrane protein YqaA with SNARE-associated domain